MQRGLRSLRSGFAISPELDRAFALGWPEMRIVVRGALDSPSPLLLPSRAWSVDDAQAHIRESFANARGFARTIDPHANIGIADVVAFARHIVPFGWPKHFDAVETDLFLIEEVIGAAVLAEIMTSALEEISHNEWKRASRAAFTPFYLLGFVLLRTDETIADAIRVRLAKIEARNADDGGPLCAAVDLVLHGGAGARRSALRHGLGELDIDPSHALLIDDDPNLIAAIVRGERFQKYDRRFAARLAFLGDESTREAIFDRWYAMEATSEQEFFFDTVVGLLTKDEAMVRSMREGAISSRIKDRARAWLLQNGEQAPPSLETPRRAKDAPFVACAGDEFGFVLVSHDAALRLVGGEDQHSRLTINADPTTTEAVAVIDHDGGREREGEERGVIFCLAEHVVVTRTSEGGLLVLISGRSDPLDDETLDVMFGHLDQRDWLPLTSMELQANGLAGLPAALGFDEARASGCAIEIADLPAGSYEVRQSVAVPDDGSDAADHEDRMLWFRPLSQK